ncbi:MAG: thiaminase II, partial [Gemmatimonas sp. SG8_17]
MDVSLTDELFEAAKPIWDAQLKHPFVTGLATGSLEVERFSRWVLQDYLYLKEFARIFAWAA